jgi:hypothetical protein
MAQAVKRVERRVVEDVTVELKLSEVEARTLHAVLMLTSGNRKTSPREHVVSILDALRRSGAVVPNPFNRISSVDPVTGLATIKDPWTDPSGLAEGTVRFRDYPEGS